MVEDFASEFRISFTQFDFVDDLKESGAFFVDMGARSEGDQTHTELGFEGGYWGDYG